jgi:hypothetical protein
MSARTTVTGPSAKKPVQARTQGRQEAGEGARRLAKFVAMLEAGETIYP